MKKWLGALFALVLVIGVLAACGPDDEPEENANNSDEGTTESTDKPEKLIVWEDQDKGAALEDAAAKFEEEHGIKIEYQEYNITEMQENMALDGNTENAPDVVTMSHDGVGPSVVKGYIAPIEVSDEVLSQYTSSSVEAFEYEGKLYGLPKATETPVFIYNKELLPEVPETMEELYELTKEATNGDEYGFLAIWDDFYHAHGIFHGFGSYVFGGDNDDPSDIGLNNDQAVEALEYIHKWYDEGLFPSGIIGETSNDQMNGLFKQGKAIAVQNGPWAFKDYQDAGIDIGIAPMPKLENGQPVGTFMGVKGWFVTNFKENQEWAQKFVEFVANEENSKTRFDLTGEIPPLVSLLEDEEWVSQNEGAAAVMEQSRDAVAMPSIPEMAEVWDPLKTAVQTVATGKAEPKEALDEAVELIKQNIEMNHGGAN
ncbi:sugar ABC transporter substrate-binding protein [Ornithinibacillus halophilus]|uniref:Maltodextrin-binding protein n=1 Tax=Ornithinibacillus halophilus TaxID=930117 RepID=A0A1M5K3V8_9BACI|nr:extracellular solute-binding protein [Ornithinibacillus halophilus]SHG47477.1 carbohydrate ABC transporter substrate-binding protein, CUT1 family [Ornithinibacillus halophilus]